MQTLHFCVPASCDGMRLNVFLRTMGVSSACIKAVKYQGTGFWLQGNEPVHTDYRVAAGQVISFSLPPESSTDVQPEAVPVDVVYEDEFATVLNKPAGIAVHPTLNHTGGTLANGWLYYLQSRGESGVFRPVNRIDKNTSGLVLCAQNAFAAPELARTAQKCYLAIVEGSMPLGPGRIDAPIARRGDSIIGRCVQKDGKPSITEYTVLASSTSHALAACFPVTGRTHQIRVHFSWMGHPDIIARHALHCAVLRFQRPVDHSARRVQSPLPGDFLSACCAAGLPGGDEIQAMLQTFLTL